MAGPTDPGLDLADLSKIDKKMYVSNIEPGLPLWSREGEHLGYIGKVDFQADATNLPLKTDSIGALFVSAMYRDIREKFLLEA